MTETPARAKLPDFNGEEVVRTEIKFTGVGTGFTGLDVRPVVMELDDEAYFVVKVKAAESASHYRDKNELLVRLQRVHAESMAPIDKATADRVLAEYAADVKKRKAEVDGQLSLDGEQAALDAEKHDDDGTPAADVAASAKERAEQATPGTDAKT